MPAACFPQPVQAVPSDAKQARLVSILCQCLLFFALGEIAICGAWPVASSHLLIELPVSYSRPLLSLPRKQLRAGRKEIGVLTGAGVSLHLGDVGALTNSCVSS